MKILFTQFAIPEVDPLVPSANVSLAPGYLLTYLKHNLPEHEYTLTPVEIENNLSIASYYDFVNNMNPDIINFSLYLWNIDKTTIAINFIKKQYPKIKIIIGGPEVNRDNLVNLEKINFDAAVIGEGESTLLNLLTNDEWNVTSNVILKNNTECFYNESEKIYFPKLDSDRNPYLQENILHDTQKTVFIETVRGCPYRCKFCNYNKRYKQLQYNDLNAIREFIRWAISNSKEEIFLLDPSFNVQSRFDEILDIIIEENSNRKLKFSTEIRADLLNYSQIKKMKEANIVEVEVGLQSTNTIALTTMNRSQNLDQIVKNVKLMQNNNIVCKIDLIIGLPNDTLADFKKSVDYVFDNNIYDSIQVFPLSVLPGTEFFKEKEKLQLNIMHETPYYLKSSPTFATNDFYEAFRYAEEKFDIEIITIPEIWLSTKSENKAKSGFNKIVTSLKNNNLDFSNITESFYIHLKLEKKFSDLEVESFFKQFEDLKCLSIFTFVFDFSFTPKLDDIQKLKSHIPKNENHFVNRDLQPYFNNNLVISTREVYLLPDNKSLETFPASETYFLKRTSDKLLEINFSEYYYIERTSSINWNFYRNNFEYDQLQFEYWTDQNTWIELCNLSFDLNTFNVTEVY